MKMAQRLVAMLLVFVLFMTSGNFPALAEAILTMPSALQIIDEKAFYGSTSIDRVVLPNEVKEIRSKAFANSTLAEINLPDSITYIADDAFDGLEQVNVLANEGTYAYRWAVEHGYISETIDAIDFSISSDALTLMEGSSYTLNTYFVPSNATTVSVAWGSSKKTVATVEQGKITAKSEGTATITAIAENGLMDTCVVTVVRNIPAPVMMGAEQDGMGTVALTWNNMGSEYEYFVYESVDDALVLLGSTADNTYTAHVAYEGIHQYCVQACIRYDDDVLVSSDESDLYDVDVKFIWNFSTTIEKIEQSTGDTAKITWRGVSPASYYEIAEVIGNDYIIVASPLTSDTATVAVEQGVHRYAVRAIYHDSDNRSWISGWSAVKAINMQSESAFAPEAPVLVFNEADQAFSESEDFAPEYEQGSIDVTWLPNEYAQSYALMLEKKTASGYEVVVEENDLASTTYIISALTFADITEKTMYRFGIRSQGEASGEYSYTYFAVTVPDTSITVSSPRWERTSRFAASRSFTVTSVLPWTAATDATWIKLYQYEDCLTVHLSENTAAFDERTGVITLDNGQNVTSITVVQHSSMYAPELTVFGEELSTDANAPTEIPAGGFAIGIDDQNAKRVMLRFSQKTNGSYDEWQQQMVTVKSSIVLPYEWENITFSAGKEFCIETSGHYSADPDLYADYECEGDAPTQKYYIKFVDEGHYALLNGQQNLEITVYEKETVKLFTSNSWTASSDADWLTFTSSRETDVRKQRLTVITEANDSGAARTGHITVTSGSASAVLTVHQPVYTGRLIEPANVSQVEASPTMIGSDVFTYTMYGKGMTLECKEDDEWVSVYAWVASGNSIRYSYIDNEDLVSGKTYRMIISDASGDASIYYLARNTTVEGYINLGSSRYKVLTRSAGASTETLALKASGSWSVTSDVSWLTASPKSGTSGDDQEVTVSVTANTTATARTGILSFKIGSVVYAKLQITQAAAGTDSVTVIVDDIPVECSNALEHVTGSGTSLSIYPYSPGEGDSSEEGIKIVSNADWITAKSEVLSGKSAGVKVAENTTGSRRSGTITFIYGTASETITITQEPKMEKVALFSPALSTDSSSPTVLTYDGNALVLKWNKIANATKYYIECQDEHYNEIYYLTVDSTNAMIVAELPAEWFDPAYTEKYVLEIRAADAYDNKGKVENFYFTRAVGNAVYINGKASESWDDVSDLQKTKQFVIASSEAWTATADVPWITFDTATGVSGDMLSVTVSANSGAARSGKVTIKSGTASAVLTINQCAVLSDYPVISTPAFSNDMTAPTVWTKADTLTVTWEVEPQAENYEIELGRIKKSNVISTIERKENLKNTGTYTFDTSELEEGQIYSITLIREAETADGDTNAKGTRCFFTITPAEPFIEIDDVDSGALTAEDRLFEAEGDEDHCWYTITSSGTWTATVSDSDWIMVAKTVKKAKQLEEDEKVPSDYAQYVGQSGDSFYISVLANDTGNVRTGSVTITTAGISTTIDIVQEQYYVIPEITSPSLGTSRSKSVEVPYQDIALKWTAGEGNTGVYDVYLYEKDGSSYTRVYKKVNIKSHAATIPLAELKENTYYRLILETELENSGETVGTYYYFHTDSANALSVSATVDWSKVDQGGAVSITAAAAGGAGDYQYAYQLLLDGEIEQETPWETLRYYQFKPWSNGDYQVQIIVRDAADKRVTYTSSYTKNDESTISVATANHYTASLDSSYQFLDYSVLSLRSWSVTNYPEWITPSVTAMGSSGDIRLVVAPNDGITRLGKIEFQSNNGIVSDLTITQTGSRSIALTSTEGYFTSDAQESTISFAATEKWTASSDSGWAAVSAKSGSSGNRTLTVDLSENTATSERTAVVSIISNGNLVQYTIHQLGRTVEQSDIKLSATSWQLNSMESESKTITITTDGNWTIDVIPAWMSADVMSGCGNGEICLYCSSNTEQGVRNGLVTIKSGTMSQDIHVSQPGNDVLASVVVFTMSESTVETGTNVEFTVQTKNADQVQLFVDDIAYNKYDVTNDQVTFTRAFSQGGMRKVAIMPIRAGETGLLSEYQYLTVNSNGALSKPEFTIEPENDYVGTAAVITVPTVEHADTYTIRIYAPDSALIVDALQISETELAASNRQITIDPEKLLAAGTYSVNVIASGKGYSQSEEGHSFTRNARNYTVSFSSPNDGAEYVPGDTIYATLNQSGGGYASIKVISPSGIETRYPDNANNTTGDATFTAYIPVEESGTYRIYGEVFALDLPAEDNVAQKEAYITAKAKGPEITRLNVAEYGKNYTWIYQSEATNLYITTNGAVETVTVKDSLAESDITVSNYALDGWNRLFTVKIPDSSAGAHTILITAFDEDTGTTTTASVDFYIAAPVSSYTAYASADTTIVTSPVSGKNVADVLGGAYFEPLTVTHYAGDWLRVSNSAGQVGFVQAASLSQNAPAGASGALAIVIPADDGALPKGSDDTITIRWKSGVAITTQTSITAVLKNVNSGATYTTYSSTLFESAFGAANIPDGLYRVYLQLTDVHGVTVKSNTVEFTLGAYSDEEYYKEWFRNEIYSRYWHYLDGMGLGLDLTDPAMQEAKKVINFVRYGSVSNGDHWWKLLNAEGESTWVTLSETEKKQMYLTLVSNLVKEDQAKIEMQLAADMSNVSDVVKTQQKNKKYIAVYDSITSVIETAGAGVETALKAQAFVAIGEGNEAAKSKIEKFMKNLLKAIYKSTDAYVKDVIENYCSEVLIDAYKEEYVKALKKACQEYVEYLEITLFGEIGGSQNAFAANLDARQTAALTYIKAYKQYMSNPDEMEKDALAALFAFCDPSITLEQIESNSSNLINALIETFQDPDTWGMLCNNTIDLLLDEAEEGLMDLVKEKSGKDLETVKMISGEIKGVLKKLLEWDYENKRIKFDWDSAGEELITILKKYGCSDAGFVLTDFVWVLADAMIDVYQHRDKGARIIDGLSIWGSEAMLELQLQIEYGIAKAAIEVCDKAWKTGEKMAGMIEDFAKLDGENNGRAMFEMYGVYLAGAFEYRATYITEAELIAWSWDYLSTMSVKELEQKRAGVITLMNNDIDALTYYRNMRRVNENAKWKFHLVLRDENGKETDRYDQDDYASYELIDAQVYWINAMKNLVTNVPENIQAIIDKYQ